MHFTGGKCEQWVGTVDGNRLLLLQELSSVINSKVPMIRSSFSCLFVCLFVCLLVVCFAYLSTKTRVFCRHQIDVELEC